MESPQRQTRKLSAGASGKENADGRFPHPWPGSLNCWTLNPACLMDRDPGCLRLQVPSGQGLGEGGQPLGKCFLI